MYICLLIYNKFWELVDNIFNGMLNKSDWFIFDFYLIKKEIGEGWLRKSRGKVCVKII